MAAPVFVRKALSGEWMARRSDFGPWASQFFDNWPDAMTYALAEAENVFRARKFVSAADQYRLSQRR